MNDVLDMLDLEIRIATTAVIRTQLEAARMRDGRGDVTDIQDERRLRALVDELIALRARQIDRYLPVTSPGAPNLRASM